MTPGNYSKYRGKNNSGKRKIQFAEEISKKINDAGVRVKRDKDKVKAKITHIETCFRSAHDFAFTETGAGIKETDEGNFRDIILKKCPWYFDLLDIFKDRASAKPKMTSDELDSEEDVSPSDTNFSDDDDDNDDGDDDCGKQNDTDDTSDKGSAGLVCSILDPSSKNSSSLSTAGSLSKSSTTSTKCSGAGGSTRPLSVRCRKKSKGDDDDLFGTGGGNIKTWVAELNNKKSKQLDEQVRHNKVMEDTCKWKAKNDELEYKFNVMKKYQEMKDMKMPKKQIVKHFPEMKDLVDDDYDGDSVDDDYDDNSDV